MNWRKNPAKRIDHVVGTIWTPLEMVLLNTTGGDCLVMWSADVYGKSPGTSTAQFSFRVDYKVVDVNQDPFSDLAFQNPGVVVRGGLQTIVPVSKLVQIPEMEPGQHVFEIYWKAGAANMSCSIRNRQFTVLELPQTPPGV